MISLFIFASLVSAPVNESSQQDEIRTVEILVPSITCYSRFQDSLRKNIVKKTPWIKQVRFEPLNQKVVLKRPEFDFGNDLLISIEIEKTKTVKELARQLSSTGHFSQTDCWVVKSGHKMKDLTMIPFADLLKKK